MRAGSSTTSEAAGARIEISRRLLASADKIDPRPHASAVPQSRRATVALATAVLVPAPHACPLSDARLAGTAVLPDGRPRRTMPLEQAQIGDLVAKVEARLREHPEDGDGWDVIAPVYYKLERFRDAANAYAHAARLKGETVRAPGRPRRVRRARRRRHRHRGGPRRLREDPGDSSPAGVEPRFWLALAKEQDGKLAPALADYRALLADAPADAPWRAARREPHRRGVRAASPVPTRASPRPRAQRRGRGRRREARAARPRQDDRPDGGRPCPASQAATAATSPAGSASINAYAVLGRRQDARAALAEARTQLHRRRAGRPRRARQTRLTMTLGLGS